MSFWWQYELPESDSDESHGKFAKTNNDMSTSIPPSDDGDFQTPESPTPSTDIDMSEPTSPQPPPEPDEVWNTQTFPGYIALATEQTSEDPADNLQNTTVMGYFEQTDRMFVCDTSNQHSNIHIYRPYIGENVTSITFNFIGSPGAGFDLIKGNGIMLNNQESVTLDSSGNATVTIDIDPDIPRFGGTPETALQQSIFEIHSGQVLGISTYTGESWGPPDSYYDFSYDTAEISVYEPTTSSGLEFENNGTIRFNNFKNSSGELALRIHRYFPFVFLSGGITMLKYENTTLDTVNLRFPHGSSEERFAVFKVPRSWQTNDHELNGQPFTTVKFRRRSGGTGTIYGVVDVTRIGMEFLP